MWQCLESPTNDTSLIHNRSLHYGDGFFTTMKVVNHRIQLWQYHEHRIKISADALFLSIDWHSVNTQLEQLLPQLSHGMIKLHFSRKPCHARGYGVDSHKNEPSECLIYYQPLTHNTNTDTQIPLQSACSVVLSDITLADAPTSLKGLKTTARTEQVLASKWLLKYQQAHTTQLVTESLVFDNHNNLVEAISSNVFFALGQAQTLQWYTPKLDKTGIAGVMRSAIIDNFNIQTKDITKSNTSDISALFLTNSVKGITPVSKIYDATGQLICNLSIPEVTSLHQKMQSNTDFINYFH